MIFIDGLDKKRSVILRGDKSNDLFVFFVKKSNLGFFNKKNHAYFSTKKGLHFFEMQTLTNCGC